MLLAVRISSYGCTWEVWRALKKLELHSANSYASFMLSKLPSCIHNSISAQLKAWTNGALARWHHLLLRPESFRIFLSCANYGFCHGNLAGITKFKYEKKNEKDSGRSSKMTPSCKWPILKFWMHILWFSFFRCKNVENVYETFVNTIEYTECTSSFFRNFASLVGLKQAKRSDPPWRKQDWIPRNYNFIAKSSRLPTKRKPIILLNFLFSFVSFIGRIFNLEIQNLVLKTTTWWTRASHFVDG